MKNKFVVLILLVSFLLTLSGCAPQPVAVVPPTAAPAPTAVVDPPTAAPQPAAAGQVVLATGDWPPYVFEGAEDAGPMAAIINAAFEAAGKSTSIVFYPWKRAEEETRAGNVFAAFPYAVSPERQKEFDFSEPLYTVKGKFFYNKKYHPEGISYEKLEDLRGLKIGGLLGSWYETAFKDAGLQVEYVSSMDQNVQKLALGRVDLITEEENSVWYLIRKLYPADLAQFATLDKPLEQPGVVNDLSLMVARNYPNSAELLKQFNAGMAIIRADGTYKQILEKYQLAAQ